MPQYAFDVAILNASCPGMVLRPAGSYQVRSGICWAAACGSVGVQGGCGAQVTYNLPGNAAHLSLQCNSRQVPFVVDLTGAPSVGLAQPGQRSVSAPSGGGCT